ncbi:filamentous hemagglutinin N-terminal domain-containing protein, partial [Geminocystis sp. GBBB08]|uniref:beta strand repeat-containing protein n=1 Tax=Geminocystis sp. GBBB08 TaxID=2604140 RepID=UPI0027E34534
MSKKVSLIVAILSILTVLDSSAQSQEITVDGNTATIVTKNGDRITIDGNTLSRDGKNLFHSFQEFGLTRQQIATFLTNPNIQNILTRVTGGNPSYINGLMEVVGGNSNLFLMNPAGIVFGQGASINVPADFTATTATGIGFNNGIFNAIGNNDYQNLTGNPTNFIFNHNQPGSIINAGDLKVAQGSNINLIAGNVINTGTIETANGKINIQAVQGTSRIKITPEGSLLSLELDLPKDEQGNLIGFTPQDLPTLLTGANKTENSILNVTIKNNQVQVANTNIPNETGVAIASGKISTSSENKGGEVTILGNKVGVINGEIEANGNRGGGKVLIGGDYQGKGTIANSQTTIVNQNSIIKANATVNGDGGKVIVWADNNTSLTGKIEAKGGYLGGNGGLVEISGKENLYFNGEVNTNASDGNVGLLLLDPLNVIITNGREGNNDSAISDGQILAGEDPLSDYIISEFALENLSGTTNVLIEATNNITVEDLSDNSLTFSSNTTTGSTPRTSVTFTADADNNGVGDFSMNSGDKIVGIGRDVNISGANITLGVVDTSIPEDNPSTPVNEANGNAGNITINATNNVAIEGQSLTVNSIPYSLASFISSGGIGNAGNIVINSSNGSISLTANNGNIITQTDNGNAGNIQLNAPLGNINLATNIQLRSLSLSGGNKGNVILTSNTVQPSGVDSSIDFLIDNAASLNINNFNVNINNSLNTSIFPNSSININGNNFQLTKNINSNGVNVNVNSNGSIFLTSDSSIISNGGEINLNASGGITTGVIDSSSQTIGGAINLTAGNNISLGLIKGGSTTQQGNPIIINTPSQVQLLATFEPQGADTIIGNVTRVSNFISPNNLNTNGGNFTLNTSTDFIQDFAIFTQGGNFNLNSLGNVAINSSIDTDGGNITVTGIALNSSGVSTPFDSSNANGDGGDITLLSNGGEINVSGLFTNSSISNGGEINITAIAGGVSLGNVNTSGEITGGNLNLNANGNITNNGLIAIEGETFLNANGNNIILDNISNDFQTVNLQSANNVILTDINDLTLANVDSLGNLINISILGDLDLRVTDTTNIRSNILADNILTGNTGITIINTDNIATSGSQTYNNPITFNQNTIFDSGGLFSSRDITGIGDNLNIDSNIGIILSGIVDTSNSEGSGGNVTLTSMGDIITQNINSFGSLNGGNVTINSDGKIAINGIFADANNTNGQGGNVNLIAKG